MRYVIWDLTFETELTSHNTLSKALESVEDIRKFRAGTSGGGYLSYRIIRKWSKKHLTKLSRDLNPSVFGTKVSIRQVHNTIYVEDTNGNLLCSFNAEADLSMAFRHSTSTEDMLRQRIQESIKDHRDNIRAALGYRYAM